MSVRILLVDDEEVLREVLGKMLTSAGYQFVEAGDGAEAIAILDSGQTFDLVISDIMMAPLDGIGMLTEIQKRYPDVSVMISSPIRDDSILKAAYELGAVDYLLLPYPAEHLLTAVRQFLELCRLKRENQELRAKLGM